MSYADIKPIEKRIPALRQAAKRHYGVHPYFTRRPYNVVSEYILHYSSPGDTVLDPFGGSGVTAIEAFLENRVGIQSDINPLANFITKGIVSLQDVDERELSETLHFFNTTCKSMIERVSVLGKSKLKEFQDILPPNAKLPKNADVEYYHDLFTDEQLVFLAVLKREIDRIKNQPVKNLFLLAWSGALARLNKTFISAKGRAETRGGSSIFSIYRYKVAKEEVNLDPWTVFQQRLESILEARKEILRAINLKKNTCGWFGKFKCYDLDVLDLEKELKESVDYIFTDPPYGGHISYLDLSTLWNVWLGMSPSNAVKEKELIVGGELGFSEDYYVKKLYDSISASFTMLKNDRWLSVVFQHWNIRYFKSILQAAEDSGAELKAVVSQIGDPIWSMHKKKGKESVLAGEAILTFYKNSGKQIKQVYPKNNLDLAAIIADYLSSYNSPVLYGEALFNHLVIESWKQGIIDDLNMTKDDLTQLLESSGWVYDDAIHAWHKHAHKVELNLQVSVSE